MKNITHQKSCNLDLKKMSSRKELEMNLGQMKKKNKF